MNHYSIKILTFLGMYLVLNITQIKSELKLKNYNQYKKLNNHSNYEHKHLSSAGKFESILSKNNNSLKFYPILEKNNNNLRSTIKFDQNHRTYQNNKWNSNLTTNLHQEPQRIDFITRKKSYPSNNDKEEILKDVEHIGHSNIGYVNTWNNKNYPETTETIKTFITKGYNQFNNNNNNNNNNNGYTNGSNDRIHICAQHKTVQIQVKTTELYSRPIYRRVTEPCHFNKICTRVQLYHEPAYRDVIRHKPTKQVIYDCCPGWERYKKIDSDCMKPICKVLCKNGGTCSQPDTCSCPAGFTGRFCEHDINECKENKPCDQLCYNIDGSYYCKCREGFYLDSDGQSCRKQSGLDDAFEARDLENEIDRGDIDITNNKNELTSRLHQIEKNLANERVATHELQKHLQSTYQTVNSLKSRLQNLEQKQQDISHLQTTVVEYENKTKKLEHLINIIFKCRTNPQPYCP